MTPELLDKIESLVRKGAVVVGNPPKRSPSLVNYPDCNRIVQDQAMEIWGGTGIPVKVTGQTYGKGMIYWGGELTEITGDDIYPNYEATSSLLKKNGVNEDFLSSRSLRYTHRNLGETQIYFVANRTNQLVSDDCIFRVDRSKPELWDPLTGETRPLHVFSRKAGLTNIPMAFEPYQSYFVVFTQEKGTMKLSDPPKDNFPEFKSWLELEGPWEVSFDPEWGGPSRVTFDQLVD